MTSLLRQDNTRLAIRKAHRHFSSISPSSSNQLQRTLPSTSSLSSSQQRRASSSPPHACHVRRLTTSISAQFPSDDPGGKPNDGSHPTVYEWVLSILFKMPPHSTYANTRLLFAEL